MSRNGGNEIGNSSDKKIQEQALDGSKVYLKIDFKFADVGGDGSCSNNVDKANFFYSYDGKDWKKIGETLGMTYDLKLFTGYKSGIYSYPTKPSGGYADIDSFVYERAAW